MRLVELFLKETTEEDRAIISLGKTIYDYLQQYADQDLDYEPDDEDAEIVRIGKLGNLFNTPLEGLDNINLTIQSDYGLSQVSSNIASEETPIPGANSPGGLWYNHNKTLVFNSDYLSTNDMKSVIVHELRHALDDVKSDYKANQSTRYETPRNKAYRDEKGKPGSNKMSYTAQPAEINARFAEVLNSLTNSLPAVAKFPDSEQTRIRAQRLLIQGLKKHQISDLFPEKEKSRDYKRLVKRGMDFITKELSHIRDTAQMTEATKRPYQTVLPDEKRYAVYDQNDKEVASFEFPAIWNSSPALKLAQAKVAELTRAQMSVDSSNRVAADEARPLSQDEQTYATVTLLFQNLMVPTKGMSVNAKDIYFKEYGEELSVMSAKLDKLHKKGGIRDSVLMGKRNS